MALYSYQQTAITALETGAVLLAAAPGAGKTRIAIEFARHRQARLILVVCPAIAQGVWLAEVPKWWPRRARCCCAT